VTKKEIVESLTKYPDDAEIGFIALSPIICGDVYIGNSFEICDKTQIHKNNIERGYIDMFNQCDALIVV
jgi:hypothetical protein